jgi:hypothetical protein
VQEREYLGGIDERRGSEKIKKERETRERERERERGG